MNVDISLRDAFLEFLKIRSFLNDEAVLAVLDHQREKTPPIGRLALESRILSMKEVNRVLTTQMDSKLRFGEQAIHLGYMEESDLEYLLQLQRDRRPKLNDVLVELEFLEKTSLENLQREFLAATAAVIS